MSSYELEESDFPPLGIVSIWYGVFVILVTAVAHISLGSPPQFWANPVMSFLQLALIALIVGSLLYLLLRANCGLRLAAVPLAVNVGTLLIIRFVNFGGLFQEARFQWHWAGYNEVVRLVESGAIQPDESGYAQLPPRYQALVGDGNTIRIETGDGVTGIFFYSSRHSPTSFSGYLYRSDGNPPQTGDFDGRWRYVAPKRPYWYFCSSY